MRLAGCMSAREWRRTSLQVRARSQKIGVPMDSIDVSLVICVRNRAAVLPLALSHLELQTHPAARFEIIIADLASTDDTRAVMERCAAGAPVPIRRLHMDTPHAAKARNEAVRQANGHWVLFLDSDLLAEPRLVEAHIRAQERRGGQIAAVGAIEAHPQIAANTFTKQYEVTAGARFLKGQPLRFIDWRAWNLSLPRAAILEVGGFDESFAQAGLEDLELAWRLESAGIKGFFMDEASAYVWCPTTLEAERQRLYAEGYSLLMLLDKTHEEVVSNRLLGPLAAGSGFPGRLLVPVYSRLCGTLAMDVRLCKFMVRRILVHSFLDGFRDASAGVSSP